MPVFYFLVLLAAVGLWVLLSFVFIPFGRFLFNTYTVAEIESYTKELEGTRDALEKQRKNNTALIANFSKLLEVE